MTITKAEMSLLEALVIRGKVIMIPDHWPPHYNACTDRCDIINGPCACGSWHKLEEGWVKANIAVFGLKREP